MNLDRGHYQVATSPPIGVTSSARPDFQKFLELAREIWARGQFTNHGPLVTELESRLRDEFSAKNVFLVSNGTLALQIGIKALQFTNEVITTPFSYVATTSSLLWEGCQPVFADINGSDGTIDADSVRSLITDQTTGILATHVYGNPCHLKGLQQLSEEYQIPVFYDVAHAFGVKCEGKPLVSFGDLSALSFHATKIFIRRKAARWSRIPTRLRGELRFFVILGTKGRTSSRWQVSTRKCPKFTPPSVSP